LSDYIGRSQVVAPGKEITVKTLYGLGGVTLAPGQLSLGLTSPGEIYATSKKHFLLVGYIVNNGGFDSKNTIVWFNLPKGFKAVEGKTQFNIGLLKAGDSTQIPIKVKLDNPSPGIKELGLTVSSTTLDSNSLARDIDCLEPPNLDIEFMVPNIKISSFNPYIEATLKISNKTRFTANAIDSQIMVSDGAQIPLYESAKKQISKLGPGEQKTLNWKLLINPPANHLIKLKAWVNSPLTTQKEFIETITFIYPDPSLNISLSDKVVTIGDYFFIQLNIHNTHFQQGMTATIQFDDLAIKPIRISPQNWVRKSGQANKVFTQKDHVGIIKIDSNIQTFEQRIAKFHFKALKKGTTQLKLIVNDQIQQTAEIIIDNG